jgi:hypothetical protein
MEYDLPTANLIWEAWAPFIVPPEGDHLAEGNLAHNFVITILRKPFPTKNLAKVAAKTLIDAFAKAITTQAFIAHTSEDSEE